MKYGLPEETLELILAYLKALPGVVEVKLYGSRAIGTFREGSDIDLALIMSDPEYNIAARVKGELEELSTPYMFDVTDYHSIDNDALKEHIDKYGLNLL